MTAGAAHRSRWLTGLLLLASALLVALGTGVGIQRCSDTRVGVERCSDAMMLML